MDRIRNVFSESTARVRQIGLFAGFVVFFSIAFRFVVNQCHILLFIASFAFVAFASVYLAGRLAEALWHQCGWWADRSLTEEGVSESEAQHGKC